MSEPLTVPDELVMPPPSEHPPLSELEHARLATRLAFMLACVMVLVINSMPIAFIGEIRPNAIKTIVLSTAWVSEFHIAFSVSAAIQAPFVFLLAFLPCCRWRRGATVLASLGGFAAGMAWVLISANALYLDYSVYSIAAFGLLGLGNLGFGFILALSRNHESLRDLQQWERYDSR